MSKFTSAMNAAKDRTIAVHAGAETAGAHAGSAAAPLAMVRRGRPPGKRSSLGSVQVTAYIRAETHYAAKLALLTNSRKGAGKKDFSDLIEELLVNWLKAQE